MSGQTEPKTLPNSYERQLGRMRQNDDRIARSYAAHNDDDISTERLLAMVMDDAGCSMERVINGLVRKGVLEPLSHSETSP